MSSIPDFSETEIWHVQTSMDQRWNKDKIELPLADVAIKLDKYMPAPAEYPAIFWRLQDCSFVIFKTSAPGFRCYFFIVFLNRWAQT